MNKIKNIHIFGGGTVSHICNHFAVCAPAYGHTAQQISNILYNQARFTDVFNIDCHLTKMAGGSKLETNEDIAAKIEELKQNPNTKIIFFNCALVDYEPTELNLEDSVGQDITIEKFGKYETRLETRKYEEINLWLGKTNKIISSIRNGRKDIFLVGFKTTCGKDRQFMYEAGLKLCKKASCNLVLVNDTKTRWNMIVTPEEAAYHETDNREEVLKNLVDMTYYRSHLTFTQSTVVEGKPVLWNDSRVPESLRKVINYCINKGAYQKFNEKTVGHFGIKLSDTEFLTSIRKSDLNKLEENGLVYVRTSGPDTVVAYGAKPSVGGQSQRIIFNDHPGFECIVHFHCEMLKNHRDDIQEISQREVECGSHNCGQNTSNGLRQFGNLKAVMLKNHGPNIVFPKNINPDEVIDFINANFDLTKKTGGYNLQ